jgi:Zn-dependent protease
MTTTLLVLALVWPLLWVLRVAIVTRILLGLELRRPTVLPVAVDAIPPFLREAAQPWISQLEGLGFRLLGGWHAASSTEDALHADAIVLAHPEHPLRAVLRPRGESSHSGECYLTLRTTTAEGFEVATCSHAGEQIVPPPPGLDLAVLATNSAGELLERHNARVGAKAATAWRSADIEGAALREHYVLEAVFTHELATGWLAERGAGSYGYRPFKALGAAIRLLREAAAKKKTKKLPPILRARELSEESRTEFDLRHYRQMRAMKRGRFSLRMKATITAVSFVIFAGVLAWRYSPVVAITLIVALVFHEGGHLVGMWLFGYRDTQLLFIPFFGGAAVGHDDKVLRPWQHVVIILLGPLPGIFIALGLFALGAGDGPAWLHQAAMTALILNAFNLLPILPLDGGQIVDFAFASRFPRARVLFLAASALGLVLLGLTLSGVTFLAVLGGLMLLRLRTEWRLAELQADIRAEFPDGGDEEPIVRRLLAEFRAPQWKKTTPPQRLTLVHGLQNLLRMPRPGFGTMCFAVAGFTAPLWLGAPLAVWASLHRAQGQVRQAEAKAEAAGLLPLAPSVAVQPATIPDENNAAVPYAKAQALAEATDDEEASPPSDPKRAADIVALLRAAARKPAFVPVQMPAMDRHDLPGINRRGQLVSYLTTAAEERLRYGESTEALAMAGDALRLTRLLQTVPGWLNWNQHNIYCGAAWNTIEQALVAGVKLTPAEAAELRGFCDERAEVDYAVAAIPQGLLEQTRWFEDNADSEASARVPRSVGVLAAILRLSPSAARMRAEAIEAAVVAHDYLLRIQRGEWPELKSADPSPDRDARMMVATLGDLLAREREARVALALIERRQRGLPEAGLDGLVADQAELRHPLTGETMRLARRGAVDVLTLASSTTREFGAAGLKVELLWRVPTVR